VAFSVEHEQGWVAGYVIARGRLDTFATLRVISLKLERRQGIVVLWLLELLPEELAAASPHR
jgi:hypothetical protein